MEQGCKTMEIDNIKDNVPTCIRVDWADAYLRHLEMMNHPVAVEYPRIYQLETTNKCNLQCVFCPRSKMTRPIMDMDDKLFKTIVDRDMQWTKSIELFGFGEPFCDRKYANRVRYLIHKGIYVVVATNGLLAQTMPDELFEHIDYMVLDVDAVDKEHYENVRRGGIYERMQENIGRILQIRRTAKKYTAVQFIDYDTGEETKQKFVEMYKPWADEVRIKFLDTFAGQVMEGEPQKCVSCLEPLYGVSVWSNGDVVMCDRDFNSINKLGNLNDQSLMEIWQGEAVKDTQKQHIEGKGENITPCDQCKEWRLTNLRNVPQLTVNMFRGGSV